MERRERAVKAFLLTSAACWIIGGIPAAAQVVLDGSLGPSGPLSGPDVTIPATVGKRAGPNLFHSFQTFSIAHGESATFTGPTGLDNVISRVTGGKVSTIDGLLRSRIPNADFWFLNPAGVFFGPNARLDVPASFHLSTADELRFADGERFRATTPGATVLTVAPPEAFGFLRANPAKIEVNESRLETKPGQVLSLVGGDISIKGEIRAERGQINLSALAGPGEVAIPDGKPPEAAGGTITLENQAQVDVSGNGGGTVRIRGGQFVLQGSAVYADNEGRVDAAGGIDVQADKVDMRQGSALTANAFGSGKGGNIVLDVGRLELRDGSQVVAGTFGPGDAGSLTVVANEVAAGFGSVLLTNSEGTGTDAGKGGNIALTVGRLELNDGSGVVAATYGPGDAGSITLDVHRLELNDGAQVAAVTVGPGDAGSLTVRANEIVATGSGSVLLTNSGGRGTDAGKGGNITLDVNRLELNDGAQVAALTFGPGDAGSLTVVANEVAATGRSGGFGSGLFANSQGTGTDAGKGGDIALTVGRLELSGGAEVGILTFGPGDAGSLRVRANEVAATGRSGGFGSGLFANSQGTGTDAGKGGDIALDVSRLELNDGAQVAAATLGPGDAGSLTVVADEVVATGVSGVFSSGLVASSRSTGTDAGKGGNITLDVSRLELNDGSQVVATTYGPGDAGSLTVVADEVVATGVSGVFFNGLVASSRSTRTDAGKGGNIALDVHRLELSDGAQVAVTTYGPGDAGSLTVRANEIVATGSGSGLFASSESTSADGGRGGTIRLNAPKISLADGAAVTTRRAGGTSGDGNIEGSGLLSGSILIEEVETLQVSGGSSITAETARADAEDIDISVARLIDMEDSAITTSVAGGQGAGGDIRIDSRFLVFDRSRIIANAREGAGGNIRIVADFIFRSPDSVIEASSQFGISGTVAIAATELDVTSAVVALPAAFLDPAVLRARCGGRPTGGTGTFTGIGRGGTGLTPDAPLPGVYSDLIEPTGSAAAIAAPAVSAAPPPAGNDTSMFAGSTWRTSCRTD